MIGRSAFILAFLASALSILLSDHAGSSRAPDPVLVAAGIALGFVWVASILGYVFLAFALRCDDCGRRQHAGQNANDSAGHLDFVAVEAVAGGGGIGGGGPGDVDRRGRAQ